MKKTNLNGISKVIFYDNSEFDSRTCRNGGGYGFRTTYTRLENGMWEISYDTTADFTYCPVCGSFDHHWGSDFYESGYTCGEFETVTETELLKLIADFKEKDDIYCIEYK